MITEVIEHEGKERTGRAMYAMVSDHWRDLGIYLAFAFPDWFALVRSIPYLSDDERFPNRVLETVSRPAWSLDPRLLPRIDCKKKAVLIASWAKGNGFPFRFIAVSHDKSKTIHHVFPQIDFGHGWVNVDATFPTFGIGDLQPATYAEVLLP